MYIEKNIKFCNGPKSDSDKQMEDSDPKTYVKKNISEATQFYTVVLLNALVRAGDMHDMMC